jgi:hypothetical protein
MCKGYHRSKLLFLSNQIVRSMICSFDISGKIMKATVLILAHLNDNEIESLNPTFVPLSIFSRIRA